MISLYAGYLIASGLKHLEITYNKDRTLPGWFGQTGWPVGSVALNEIGLPSKANLERLLDDRKSAAKYGRELEGYLLAFTDFKENRLEAETHRILKRLGPSLKQAPSPFELSFLATALQLGFNKSAPLTKMSQDKLRIVLYGVSENAAYGILAKMEMVCATGAYDYSPFHRRWAKAAWQEHHGNRYVGNAYALVCSAGSPKGRNWGKDGKFDFNDAGFDFPTALKVRLDIRDRWPDYADNLWFLGLIYEITPEKDKTIACFQGFISSATEGDERVPQARKMIAYLKTH